MNTYSITYTSYAMVPSGIDLGKTYQFGKDKNGYFIADINGKRYMELEYIKELFSPINTKWEDILSTKKITNNK